MRHARPDYNRIQDPAAVGRYDLPEGSTPIGDDEPVFLIRAQDIAGPNAVRTWAMLAEAYGADESIVELALEWAEEMERWQHANKRQVPDLP